MRQAVSLLDRFIKDTTHELNTPVTTILSNIETIDQTLLEDKIAKKLQRIDIASRTISTLYDDLTFLVLNHNLRSKEEALNLCDILKERIEYFALTIKQKKLKLTLDIEQNVNLFADHTKICRLFDNLISNAIKYNHIQGDLTITLKPHSFIIQNSGKGIPQEKLPNIFNRYMRADDVAGGFGIGLHIVAKIAALYNIEVTIDSILNKTTRITLSW